MYSSYKINITVQNISLPGSDLIDCVSGQFTALTSCVRVAIEIAGKVRGELVNLALCIQSSTGVIEVNIVFKQGKT